MSTARPTDGDYLLTLLGASVDDPRVRESLATLAHGMEPDLEAEESLVDWVTVNEIGLEYGFEDVAYVRAEDPDKRGDGRVLLSQLYFYNETPQLERFPHPLPLQLDFNDDRRAVREKLAAYEATRRSYFRDAWRLPEFDLTVEYGRESGTVASVFCHLPYAPWPALPGAAELAAAFPPEVFVSLFGLRWSSVELRTRLAPFGYVEALPQVRSEHIADLLGTHGVELTFAPGADVPAADPRHPRSLALAGVSFYANRVQDAREWSGALPFGLAFSDSQAQLRAKVGEDPAEVNDEDRSGLAVWHFAQFTLTVLYSNIENRIFAINLFAPGFWSAVNAADPEDADDSDADAEPEADDE